MADQLPVQLVPVLTGAVIATRSETDAQLVESWLANLPSAHARRNFKTTAERFLSVLGMPMRQATVEDVRTALEALRQGVAESTGRQYVTRVRSLFSYAHSLGYLQFNACKPIRLTATEGEANTTLGNAGLSKRILTEIQVSRLLEAGRSERDRVMLNVLYAGGLRVSEVCGLAWRDVIGREAGRVQLHVIGKRRKVRQVILPALVSEQLLALRRDAGDDDPVFRSRKGGGPMTERGIWDIVRRAAKRAGLRQNVSPHWLRHAHASHALDKGVTVATVKETLGHANITTTSEYLHARPGDSSGLALDEGVFAR